MTSKSQVFAVLSETVSGTAVRDLMARTMYDSFLVQWSSALQFYVFGVVEKVGILHQDVPRPFRPWEADARG